MKIVEIRRTRLRPSLRQRAQDVVDSGQIRIVRRLRVTLVAVALVVSSVDCGGTSDSANPQGPDAGAGCDSAIHAHCVFAQGIGVSTLGAPVCIEYSGAPPDHSSCEYPGLLGKDWGAYALGSCPRDAHSKACVLNDQRAAGAPAGCEAFETIWTDSLQWSTDAAIPGYPDCVSTLP